MTYTDSDGHRCRDAKLFDERLLKKNLELYFDLGGCNSFLAENIQNYETPKTGNCTDGLTNLIADFIATVEPYDDEYDSYYSVIDDLELDKIVEKMRAHGIRITKAQLARIRNSNYEQEQSNDFGLMM